MKLAAHLLEVAEEDIEYEAGKFSVRGAPDQVKSIQDVAFAAYTNYPEDMEAGLEGVYYYNPPNLTFPFGTYVVSVEVDPDTGVWKVRRMIAVDDCGVRINPMIVEGQIHGGLTEGYATAAMQLITFDEVGNAIGTNFMDYLIPTAWETPKFELGETVTPSPHHPIGAKGVGESATVGSPAAYVNAVIDALWPSGVKNIDMPRHVGEGLGGDGEGEGGRLRVKPEVLQLAAELSARGEPFVLATVVWRRAPSSGKEGATALITPDGKVRGWLGGACAEPTVVREALRALEEGSPRLLFLGPPEELEGRARDGVVTVPIACQSEGALEVYVEPVLPQPQIVAIGRSPVAGALAALGDRPRLAQRPDRRRSRRPDVLECDARSRLDGRPTWSWRRRDTSMRTPWSMRWRRPPHTSVWWRPASGPTPCSATCATAASPTRRSRASTRRPGSTSATCRPTRSPSRSSPRSCS